MTDNLDEYLASLPDRLKEPISEAIKEQAERLSGAQRSALQSLEQAPAESGELEASCTVVAGENDLEFIVQAGGAATTTDVRAGSGKDFDYGEAFEYGTRHQPARPFFWPTYNAMRDEMRREIQDAVSEALE